MKIYCTEGANNYASWIDEYEIVDNPEDANIIIFTGGEDVDPSLYGHKTLEGTYSNLYRDIREKEIFENMHNNQLAVGCCRGSQLLCILNGGKLIQDVSRHAIGCTHLIYPLDHNYNNGKVYDITSTHHQMQYPFNLDQNDYDILYHANYLSQHYYSDGLKTPPCEPEIVYYHVDGKPKCLAIQGHPEYMRKESPVISYLNKLIIKLTK